MKVTVLHGQNHKGTTYTITHTILQNLLEEEDELQEFFLPKDAPDFCCGCAQCFMKGEEHCPSADKVQPIAKAIDWADVILLDSPNYVLEMSGSMKNLMDHLAYQWVVHRPKGSMFRKVGIVVSSSAGAPCGSVVKSLASQLRWWCVSKVYTLGLACQAAPGESLKPERKALVEKKARKLAKAVKHRLVHHHAGIIEKAKFHLFRKMQSSPSAAWNPTDRDWWVNQGWTENVRPWR